MVGNRRREAGGRKRGREWSKGEGVTRQIKREVEREEGGRKGELKREEWSEGEGAS